MKDPVLGDEAMAEPRRSFSVFVPESVRRRMISLAALRDKQVAELVTTALQEYLRREYPETEGMRLPPSNPMAISHKQAERAQNVLGVILNYPSWLRGIGIMVDPSGSHFLKVNVQAVIPEIKQAIPSEIEGVPVKIAPVGLVRPLHENAPLSNAEAHQQAIKVKHVVEALKRRGPMSLLDREE